MSIKTEEPPPLVTIQYKGKLFYNRIVLNIIFYKQLLVLKNIIDILRNNRDNFVEPHPIVVSSKRKQSEGKKIFVFVIF